MTSYAVLKTNKKTKETKFLMANALGTKTFKNDMSNVWSNGDHRDACEMMSSCILKHCDDDKFIYSIDDIDESGDW